MFCIYQPELYSLFLKKFGSWRKKRGELEQTKKRGELEQTKPWLENPHSKVRSLWSFSKETSYLWSPSENTLHQSFKFNNVFWPFLWEMINPVYSSYWKTQNKPGQASQFSDPPFIFNEGALSEVCSTEVAIQVLWMPQVRDVCSVEPKWWINCSFSLTCRICSERGTLVITKKAIL